MTACDLSNEPATAEDLRDAARFFTLVDPVTTYVEIREEDQGPRPARLATVDPGCLPPAGTYMAMCQEGIRSELCLVRVHSRRLPEWEVCVELHGLGELRLPARVAVQFLAVL